VPQVLHKCDCCLDELPRTAFEDSAWAHRSDATRRTLCKECKHPQCAAENCKTCRSCRRVECQERDCRKPVAFDLHSKHLPQNKAERDQYRCEKCRSDQHSDLNKNVPQVLHKCDGCLDELPRSAFDASAWHNKGIATRRTLCKECKDPPQALHKCDCCLDELPRTAFEDSAWANKSKATQRTLCKECKHPQCTVENCKTCRSCRSTKCKNKNCRKPFAFNVHSRNQPKDKAARERFRCDNCCFPACSDCGAKMPEGSRSRFLQSGAFTWTCSECQKYPHCSCCQASMPRKRRQYFVRSTSKMYTCVACQEKEIARKNRQHC
jgi:uncharacterized protein (DUF924 family)